MSHAKAPASGTPPPVISVIMPTYNRAAYIRQAIESVLSQEGPALELIVVDDGSTDATPDILKGFPAQKIRYLRQENQGPAAARNTGVAEARGELIAFLDSDDYYLPGKLAAQARLLQTDRRLGAVHSGWRIVDENGNPQREVTPWVQAPALDLKTWLMWKPVFLGGLLVRAEWLRKAGPFNPRLFQTDDVEMMFRLAAAGCRMRWLKQPTVCYRQHSANITRDGRQQSSDLMAAIDSFFALDGLSPRTRGLEKNVRYYTLLWLAFDMWRKGDDAGMTECLGKTVPLSLQAGEQTVVTWHSHLIRRAVETGMAADKQAALAGILCRIPLPDNPDPEFLQRTMRWLFELWWAYPRGERPDTAALVRLLAGLTPREIVKALQTAIVAAPQNAPLESITAFWNDLLRAGLVPAESRHEITTLYLTVLAQAVFSRRGRLAAAALPLAVRAGATWRALPAWGRFLRAALIYGFSPKSRKPNTIAQIKALQL
jgi:glycosyltransferase involved in cell wall biosynthesis